MPPAKPSRKDSPEHQPADGEAELAWRFRLPVVLFALTALAGTAADLLSKHWVFAALDYRRDHHIEVVPGLLRFSLSTNPGIVFGIDVLPPWAVLAATLLAVAAVAGLFATSSRKALTLHIGLGMILGGALGNVYDRLFSRVHFCGESGAHLHEVRDFIDVYAINYPIFNVADMLLVVGVGVVILHTLFHRESAGARKP